MIKWRNGLLIVLLLAALFLVPRAALAQPETVTPVTEQAVQTADTRGDLVQFTGDIVVNTGEVVRGNVVAMAGNIEIKGRVLGNVTAMAGNITLRPGSFVGGDVTTMAGNIRREEGAQVGGRIGSRTGMGPFGEQWSLYNHHDYYYQERHYPGEGFVGWLLSLIGLLALAAIAIVLFPEKITSMQKSLVAEPLRLAGIGLLGWIALPVVLLALALTIIGLPVALLVLLCLPLVVLIGLVSMSLFAGERLDQALAGKWANFTDSRPLIRILKGMVLIWIIKAIPFVGWLVWPLAAIFGLGVILATRFGTNRPWFNSGGGKPPEQGPPPAATNRMPAVRTPAEQGEEKGPAGGGETQAPRPPAATGEAGGENGHRNENVTLDQEDDHHEN